MAEVRNFAEGALRWAPASGTTGWTTASGAATALVGYVQAGTRVVSARNIATVMDRGEPKHFKFVSKDAVEVTFTFLEAVTANNPASISATAAGASVPKVHFELKMAAPEIGASSALYYQFSQGVLVNDQFTEQDEPGNAKQQTWRFLGMTGPTASGYVA